MKKMNIITKIIILLILTALLFTTQYCKDGSDPVGDKFVMPDSGISFIDDVAPMLEFYCGTDRGCHSPFDIDEKFKYLDLTVKVSLMNYLMRDGERMINISKHKDRPQDAPFYILLTRGYPQDDDIMPPYSRRQLNENQTEGIKRWIAEGVPD